MRHPLGVTLCGSVCMKYSLQWTIKIQFKCSKPYPFWCERTVDMVSIHMKSNYSCFTLDLAYTQNKIIIVITHTSRSYKSKWSNPRAICRVCFALHTNIHAHMHKCTLKNYCYYYYGRGLLDAFLDFDGSWKVKMKSHHSQWSVDRTIHPFESCLNWIKSFTLWFERNTLGGSC